jgi:hypothetical protein
VVAVAAVALVASASAAGKPYSVVIAPTTVPSSSTATFTATLTNETAHQQLGSANLFPPSGFDVTGASVGSGTATIASGCTLSGAAAGPCVELRDLALGPGGSTTATLTVQTPSPCGSYAWRVEAKQANDFQGTPGNDLDLDGANSNLTTQVSSPCATSLGFGVEPHNAFVDDPLTGADLDPTGPPVTVEVLDENGNLLPSAGAPVSVKLGNGTTGAQLAGTKTVNASGGVATFANLSVDTPGDGYTLTASSPGLTAAISSPFNVTAPPFGTTPPPVYGKTANIEPVGGTVCFRLPDQTHFKRLVDIEQVPIGSILDTSNGKARLFTAKTRDSSTLQHGLFSRGPFRVTQSKHGRAYTKLTLLSFSSRCAEQPTAGTRAGATYNAHKHCRRHHSRRYCKRLYGSGSGSYRTSGDGGSGSTIGRRVPGGFQVPVASTGSRRTKWLTANRRNGTYFRVDKGKLVVRDFARHRKVRLHAGQHYLARFNP